VDIYASLVSNAIAEAIMIGRGGEHITTVGTDARRQISALLAPGASGTQGEGAQGVQRDPRPLTGWVSEAASHDRHKY
jgi:hypothetical protein